MSARYSPLASNAHVPAIVFDPVAVRIRYCCTHAALFDPALLLASVTSVVVGVVTAGVLLVPTASYQQKPDSSVSATVVVFEPVAHASVPPPPAPAARPVADTSFALVVVSRPVA